MKKLLLVPVLLAFTLLGCEKIATDPDGATEDAIAKLVATTSKLCSFVPTINTASKLVTVWNLEARAGAEAFAAVAKVVCDTVTRKSGDTNWAVKGPEGETVEIDGSFLELKVEDDTTGKPDAPKPDTGGELPPFRPGNF